MKINQRNNRVSTPFGDFQIDVDNIFDHVFGDRNATQPASDWKPRVSVCLLYTSPSPRDQRGSRMPSSA